MYHFKQVNDLLCSYNLVSCGALSKSDITSAIQNFFANIYCSYFCIISVLSVYHVFMFYVNVYITYVSIAIYQYCQFQYLTFCK